MKEDMEYYLKRYLDSHKELLDEYKKTQERMANGIEKLSNSHATHNKTTAENISKLTGKSDQILDMQHIMITHIFRYIVIPLIAIVGALVGYKVIFGQ